MKIISNNIQSGCRIVILIIIANAGYIYSADVGHNSINDTAGNGKNITMGNRLFNSKLDLKISVLYEPAGEWKFLGETPSDKPIRIPKCFCWRVNTCWLNGIKAFTKLFDEVIHKKIPGVAFEYDIPQQCFQHIAKINSVYSLSFKDCNISYSTHKSVGTLTNLRRLDLVNCWYLEDHVIQMIAEMPKLKIIDFRKSKMGIGGFEYLGTSNTLQYFKFEDVYITPLMIKLLGNNYVYLMLRNCWINDHVMNCIGSNRITYLDLSENPNITDNGLDILKICQNIRYLNLSNCKRITTKTTNLISNLNELREVNLSGCGLLSDSSFVNFKKLKNLKSLNIGSVYGKIKIIDGIYRKVSYSNGPNITDKTLKYIQNIKNIEELNLVRCDNITDTGLQIIACYDNLQQLNLLGCKNITDTGLEALAKLDELKYLNLGECNSLTSTGIKHISNCKSLTILIFGSDAITDEALITLNSIPNLNEVTLSNSKNITNAGLNVFIKNHTKLKTLKLLHCNKISDKGIIHLSKLNDLVKLCVIGMNLTSDGLDSVGTISGLKHLTIAQNSTISDDILHSISKCDKLERLIYYYFSPQRFRGVSVSGLQPISNLRRLQYLNIGRLCKTNQHTFLPLVDMKKLKYLRITSYNGEYSENAIEAIGNLEELLYLYFDYGCIKLSNNLEKLKSLQKLQGLGCIAVDEISVDDISILTNLARLQSLNINIDNNVRMLGRLKQIRCLTISGGIIDDGNIKYIGQLENLEKLTMIDNLYVSDKGLSYLRNLHRLELLKIYKMSNNIIMPNEGNANDHAFVAPKLTVTKEGLLELKKYLHNIQIFTININCSDCKIKIGSHPKQLSK